jgi:hypothetical protein
MWLSAGLSEDWTQPWNLGHAPVTVLSGWAFSPQCPADPRNADVRGSVRSRTGKCDRRPQRPRCYLGRLAYCPVIPDEIFR